MAKAKTASKNAPSNRGAVQKYFYNGKEIVPIKYVGLNSQYMAACYVSDGTLVGGEDEPQNWAEVAVAGQQ